RASQPERAAARAAARRARLARPRAGASRHERSLRDRPRVRRVGRAAPSEPLGPVKWTWLAVVALAAAAVAGTFLLARGNSGSGAVAPHAPLTVQASLDRDTVEFGDPVTATVTVLL